MSPRKWHLAIDRGGTFTDVIAISPQGRVHLLKLLSQSPLYRDPVEEALRRLTAKVSPFSKEEIGLLRLGTTVATNALLESKGGRVLLVVTDGFRDLLRIGYQQRRDLFSFCDTGSKVLWKGVCEVPERTGPDGKIIRPLDEDLLRERLRRFSPREFDSVALLLLHSWRNPEHELRVEAILKEMGFIEVYPSHRVSPEIKAVPRGNATVVDAYLGPVINRYVEDLRGSIGEDVPVEFFTSSGGTVGPEAFTGRRALLSGPAGGAVAVKALSEALGIKSSVGFDMGGTSTDVCRYHGSLAMVYEKDISGIEIKTEMVDINTIASGGGSVLWFDGQRLRVGPHSAGAEPGPACYGFGGPPTITDANLITGRIVTEFMPETFGPDRKRPLLRDASFKALEALCRKVSSETGQEYTPRDLALGYLRIANEMMANAIKEMTLAKGLDVRDFVLIGFGGAAGQHACFVAEMLQMKEVILHPLAGLFSALGIGLARPIITGSFTFMVPFREDFLPAIEEAFRQEQQRLSLGEDYIVLRQVGLRAKGSEGEITVQWASYSDMLQEFVRTHRQMFGFFEPGTEIETLTLRITAYRKEELLKNVLIERQEPEKDPVPVLWQEVYTERGTARVPVFRWEDLPVGYKIEGPVLIVNPFTTVVVPENFIVQTDRGGLLRATWRKEAPEVLVPIDRVDPACLEVFHRAFQSVATEMGEVLQRTARSVNIKERLDYSCAVFTPEGDLVANAPHIPVHLGAMAETVKELLKSLQGQMKEGDVYLSNNPYGGGSHLPDLTVVQPVFSEEGRLLFFVASRGHHPDIGGTSPGSIPAFCGHIDEEGVLIDRFLLMRDGHLREEALLEHFRSHPYPPRNPEDILYDLIAQIGACRRGEMRLKELTGRYSYPVVRAYMDFIMENGERAIRQAIVKLLNGKRQWEKAFEDRLDDNSLLKVRIKAEAGPNPPETASLTMDFSGTSEQHRTDNLNAPLAVTKAALLYVLRSIVEDEIPLNSGCLRPVRLIVPEGTMLNPLWPCPVGSGNVETSQRVVDLVLGCLGIAAGSQGTMNNLLFQVKGEVPYYETIGGGYGGSIYCKGPSAVQVHMTNTRITDPEVLELRHPGIRLRRFSVRQGSGGKGRHPGGDGIIRDIEFLKEATVTVVTERRRVPAFGLNGGGAGRRGVNILWPQGQRPQEIPHRATFKVGPGTRLIIKTPGGGGFNP